MGRAAVPDVCVRGRFVLIPLAVVTPTAAAVIAVVRYGVRLLHDSHVFLLALTDLRCHTAARHGEQRQGEGRQDTMNSHSIAHRILSTTRCRVQRTVRSK